MADFLLELLSEEIPARMQEKARADLARLFADALAAAGLKAEGIETYATPRRLALIARGLPEATEAVSEEIKGPRTSAPPQALEGFLRKTGLTQDQLVERDGIWFAQLDKPGRATASVLAEAIPAIVRGFPWPKSMRWGEASASTESLRWVRPLHGIVALLGEEIVECEVAGVRSGAATVGHRFHHPGPITLGGAHDYVEKLRACHVIVDAEERKTLIREGAARVAGNADVIPDEGLVAENAGLTELPVPLLGKFDPAFLEVPPEVIQLTLRTNQKYFVCGKDGELWSRFVFVANVESSDPSAIVSGNEKVLAARLADARFFWEQDLKVPLEDQAAKLGQIVFHEKLGTVADKVERVAKLARWLVEEGIVTPRAPAKAGALDEGAQTPPKLRPSPEHGSEHLAALAERAARLCKADLVTGLVGEFPELQGVIGGHLARAQGEDPAVADAIRDHYKPVGQGDDVPTAPVTVAVSLADKLDTLVAFFSAGMMPTGSKDPFALRRAALSLISMVVENRFRFSLFDAVVEAYTLVRVDIATLLHKTAEKAFVKGAGVLPDQIRGEGKDYIATSLAERLAGPDSLEEEVMLPRLAHLREFFVDRLKVQQREAGVRHDLIDAVFALGQETGNVEDDLVRLLARVKALQAFVETAEGADLLAGYKRAANILKKEGWPPAGGAQDEEQSRNKPLSYTPEKEEEALISALDSAEPAARAAVEAEDFEAAMRALALLRAPVDAFFDKVTVNDADPVKRAARLDLLLRMRDAVHSVADFSRIEG